MNAVYFLNIEFFCFTSCTDDFKCIFKMVLCLRNVTVLINNSQFLDQVTIFCLFRAVASSAPILQFEGLTPCEKFSQIVTDNFKYEGVSCAKSIRKSWDVIRKIGKSS